VPVPQEEAVVMVVAVMEAAVTILATGIGEGGTNI
jgi:hypothetical protein